MEEMQTKVEELKRTKAEEIRDLHNLKEMKNQKLKELEGEHNSSHIERKKLIEVVDIRGSNKGRETEQTKPCNGKKPDKTSTDIVWFKGQNHEY